MDRTPEPGKIFYLAEDKPYQIITMGIHKETGESMVIYQALYGEFKTFVLPLSRFLNEVKTDVFQIHNQDNKKSISPMIDNKQKTLLESEKKETEEQHDNEPEDEVNAVLIDFLDANTYSKKLEVITSNLNDIDDRLINNMAVSLDCTVEDGPIDQRLQELIYCLNQKSRFEDKRF
ncbi:MAG: DUF1653 domain-containing protein [Clostridiales bacterium]|nr:DUF1653 domain-containing protein [Clostridiales bacterium]